MNYKKFIHHMKWYDLIEHDKNKKILYIFRERKLNENIFRIILRASYADIYENLFYYATERRKEEEEDDEGMEKLYTYQYHIHIILFIRETL